MYVCTVFIQLDSTMFLFLLPAPEEENEEKKEEDSNDDEEEEEEELTGMTPGQPLPSNLPLHILETMFAHLSMRDLMNCSLVCKRWSTIIRKDKVVGRYV